MNLLKGATLIKFKKTSDPNLEKLDAVISECYDTLAGYEADSDEFEKTSDQLAKLIKLRYEIVTKKKISYEAVLASVTNLLGIGIIIGHERLHVIGTKALGFVSKPKI